MNMTKINNTLSLLFLFSLVCALSWVPACTSPEKQVEPTTFKLSFVPSLSQFDSKAGWSIELRKAQLSLRAVRFQAGAQASASRKSKRAWYAMWSPFRQAWAHPGHFQEGEVKAELLYNNKLDLIASNEVELGTLQAYTGLYQTASISLGLEKTLTLEGTATKGQESVPFQGTISIDTEEVAGLPFVHDVTTQHAHLLMKIDIPTTFSLIDFSTFQKTDGQVFTPDPASNNILKKAVVSSAIYTFQWKQK